MNRIATFCAAAAVACTLTACNPSTPPPAASTYDADVKAIQDNETQWVADYATRDAAKITAHYAGDAVLMGPGMPRASGKDAIQKMITGMVSDPALSLKFLAARIDVATSGDLGYSQGTYTMAMTDPQTKKVINDHGSYVTTYRKQADGSWKAVADIATSEVPPPMPAPAKKH